jgi:DNA-binding phage protein
MAGSATNSPAHSAAAGYANQETNIGTSLRQLFGDSARAKGMMQVVREVGLGRESLCNVLSPAQPERLKLAQQPCKAPAK